MSEDRWKRMHTGYKNKDWINKPSIFATQVLSYLPKKGSILELGAGLGQDSRYFADEGFSVTSTDKGELALKENRKRSSNTKVVVEKLELENKFPYSEDEFDAVYAHLSLHYFDYKKTQLIFDEIYRVLKPGGVFAFLTNSVDDPEFDTGVKLEDHYFATEGLSKRYFNPEEAAHFSKKFETILCDNEGETYKDSAKGIHNLIRYIGTK